MHQQSARVYGQGERGDGVSTAARAVVCISLPVTDVPCIPSPCSHSILHPIPCFCSTLQPIACSRSTLQPIPSHPIPCSCSILHPIPSPAHAPSCIPSHPIPSHPISCSCPIPHPPSCLPRAQNHTQVQHGCSLCSSSCSSPPSPGAAANPEFISMQSALIWDAAEGGADKQVQTNKHTNYKAKEQGCCGS